MLLLYFMIYVVVEISALVWIGSAIGVLWTLALIIATSVLGFALVRSQGRNILSDLRTATRGSRDPSSAVADGALVALGALLIAVPGLVSTVFGLLLLFPLSRALVRPVVSMMAARRVGAMVAAGDFARNRIVVDGQVVTEPSPPVYRPSAGPLIIEGQVEHPDR